MAEQLLDGQSGFRLATRTQLLVFLPTKGATLVKFVRTVDDVSSQTVSDSLGRYYKSIIVTLEPGLKKLFVDFAQSLNECRPSLNKLTSEPWVFLYQLFKIEALDRLSITPFFLFQSTKVDCISNSYKFAFAAFLPRNMIYS